MSEFRRDSGPSSLHVLIAGGGVAAAEALIALRALAADRVSITLLSPDSDLVYRPTSVGVPFGRNANLGRPLADFGADFDVVLERGSLAWVAPSFHTAYTDYGRRLGYDVLVVATGARRSPKYEHALTFRGHEDTDEMRAVVEALDAGQVRRLAFVVPPGIAWTLPIYELALMAAASASAAGQVPELTIVTPEAQPLAIFGPEASAELEALLAAAGIECLSGVTAEVPNACTVTVAGGRALEVDRVVALPELRGPAIRGLPCDDDGFLSVTPFGHVLGVKDVYAAGDGTAFPIKQGGVACQQADVVAEVIARRAGAPVTPTGHRPVLRGTLLTGARPRWLRTDPGDRRGRGAAAEVADHVLWWPPGKVAGRYLAPYLGEDVSGRESTIKGRAVISTGRDHGEVKLVALGSPDSKLARA